jgi:hypothetical protein
MRKSFEKPLPEIFKLRRIKIERSKTGRKIKKEI